MSAGRRLEPLGLQGRRDREFAGAIKREQVTAMIRTIRASRISVRFIALQVQIIVA